MFEAETIMNPADRLKAQIMREGPLPLDLFLDMMMNADDDSYYSNTDRFGEKGDFTTAPKSASCLVRFWRAFKPGYGKYLVALMPMK